MSHILSLHARRARPPADDESGGLLPALILLACVLTALAGLTLYSDRAEGQYMVMGAPFAGSGELVSLLAGTDAAIIGAGGFSNLLIISSDDPEIGRALRAAGAWAVLPVPRAFGCGTTNPSAEGRA